jgi:hypothetical protein
MVFLGILPVSERKQWISILNNHRKAYNTLKNEILFNPRNDTDPYHKELVVKNHPLSNHKDSKWAKYFSKQEKKTIIYQDIIRMYHFIVKLSHKKFFNYFL